MRITVLLLLLAWARAFRPSALRPSVRGGRLFAERSDDELIIPSSVGAALVGLTTGGLLDGALANGDAPWSPILGAVVGAGGAFYVASEVNGKPSELVKGLIGKPTAALGVSIKLYFVNKATEIKEAILAVPGNVKKAVQKKIDETVADIKAIPTNTQIAAQKAVDDAQIAAVKRVEDTIADIKAIPSNTQKAIFQRAEDLTEAAKKQVEKTTAEIVSFPERTVSEVQKSVERTTKSIEKDINAKLSAVGLIDSPSASSSKPKPKPSAPTVPAKPSTTAKSAAPEGLIDLGSLFGGASEPAPAPVKPSTSTASPKASAAPAAKVPATKSPSASSSSAAPEVMFDFGGLFGGSKASPAPAPKPKSPPSKSADPASKAAPALPPKAPAPKATTPSGGFFGLGASKPSVPASVKPAPTPAQRTQAQAQAVTAEAKKADDAVNKRQQQEAAMKRFAELEAVKKASAAKPKPAPAAPAPKAAAPAPVPAPLAKSKSLSQNAVKVLTNTGAQPAAISRVDEAVDKYLAGSIGPEGLYQAVKAAVGNSSAFSVFPDVVGSLPRGERKSKLNEWFQSQAN